MKFPWYTSNDLIESIKRKIAIPISQITFTNNDLLSFCDEEMFIAQVPKVLSFHSEYFTAYKIIPLVSNVSRYPIPDRAIAQKIRDVFWMDGTGNLRKMTQLDEHDRSYFQNSSASNQVMEKFFFEGNDIVLTPGVTDGPIGSLFVVFYLRPNQLVKNDRAAIINNFQQTITLHNSLISPLDTVNLAINSSATQPFGNVTFTAVNTLGGAISSITNQNISTTLIQSTGHQLSSGQTITISGSNSNPLVNGTYLVTVVDANHFTIPVQIATSGNSGTFTCANQFQIGASDSSTAANLAAAISSVSIISGAISNLGVVTLNYSNIYMQIIPSNTVAFVVPSTTIGINFLSLPNTYTDNETNLTENLFVSGAVIDFLQTKPGHRTHVYDVSLPTNSISGTVINIPLSSIQVPSGTITSGAGVQLITASLVPGDYICLANESIIPQIPPDLHNGLAEMAASRILSAQGDAQGLQSSLLKIQDIETKEGNLMANRSDGNPLKVTNRNSLLNAGKFGRRRRW